MWSHWEFVWKRDHTVQRGAIVILGLGSLSLRVLRGGGQELSEITSGSVMFRCVRKDLRVRQVLLRFVVFTG